MPGSAGGSGASSAAGHGRGRHLVSVDLKFVTEEAAEPLTERIREAVRNIVGREALEEFRWRAMPLDADRRRGPS